MTVKKLILIRGVSGSGKSTKAQKIILASKAQGFSTSCNEADHFRYKWGTYIYRVNENASCHKKCLSKTAQAMQNNTNVVVVANTFIKKAQLKPYLCLANKHGYSVEIIVMQGNYPNRHGVPKYVVQAMKNSFEP